MTSHTLIGTERHTHRQIQKYTHTHKHTHTHTHTLTHTHIHTHTPTHTHTHTHTNTQSQSQSKHSLTHTHTHTHTHIHTHTHRRHTHKKHTYRIPSHCGTCTYIRNVPNFMKPKKCTLDSLMVHATLPRFRIQVHAPQCGGIRCISGPTQIKNEYSPYI